MKDTGDKIFDYNVKVFDAIFGPKPDLAELDRDEKIDARQERKADRDEERDDFDFERDCGARP